MKGMWTKLALAAIMSAMLAAPAFAKNIKIAVASPFTGPAAAYGDNIKAGVTLKVEEINAKGGIKGDKIEVAWMDEQCDPKEAATVATKISMDKDIVGVVGHLCSSAHLAALPTYVRKGIPAISPTATNVSISDKNKDGKGKAWTFRNVYRDDFQGKFLAQYVQKVLGLKSIAIFYENNDYGIGLKDAFKGEAKKIGLNVVGEEAYISKANDFNPQLTKIKGMNPDGLFISGYYGEGAVIASQAAKQGLKVVKFGADGIDNEDYLKIGGADANNTYMTVPFLAEAAGPEAKDFIAKFKTAYKRELDWMSANAYDAAGLLIEAIEKAGTDRAKVRDYLAGLNTADKAYKGITGKTFFDANGDCQKPAFVKMVKDGKFVPAAKQLN